MKKTVFILVLAVLVISLLIRYTKKDLPIDIFRFPQNDSILVSHDSISSPLDKQKSDISPDINNYDIPYNGNQLAQYLLPSQPKQDEIITHIGYTLAYNEQNEEADWVAYELTKAEVQAQRKRIDSFKPDPYVSTGSATLADYKSSGYDRGHLAPFADMKWSEQAMKESFYMSNMTPQKPEFNQGIWEELESCVRNWAISDQQVYVVTGPVFNNPPAGRNYIGMDKVAIPDAFFKIILDFKQPGFKVISFLIPNERSMNSYWDYTVSIDTIEKKTGLDFFSKLPESIEIEIERENNVSGWR